MPVFFHCTDYTSAFWGHGSTWPVAPRGLFDAALPKSAPIPERVPMLQPPGDRLPALSGPHSRGWFSAKHKIPMYIYHTQPSDIKNN